MRTCRVWLVLVVFSIACSGGNGTGIDGGGDVPAIDAAAAPPDADNTGFTSLIGRSWSLRAGQPDTFRCVRVTPREDVYVHAFRATAPLGTHHSVLGLASGGRPDGDYDCSTTEIGHQMLFASGVGTPDLQFPPGVAVKIRAGQQIVLNLHLYNASDDVLAGTSGVLVETLRADQVQQEAESVFAGRLGFGLEATQAPHREQPIDGGCTVDRAFTLFALWPHMHKLGTHLRVVLRHGGTDRVLHDLDYSFEEQKHYVLPSPVAVQEGDAIGVRCTYVNTTGEPVGWGDGSNDEMCFAGLYRYPASGGSVFECTGGAPF